MYFHRHPHHRSDPISLAKHFGAFLRFGQIRKHGVAEIGHAVFAAADKGKLVRRLQPPKRELLGKAEEGRKGIPSLHHGKQQHPARVPVPVPKGVGELEREESARRPDLGCKGAVRKERPQLRQFRLHVIVVRGYLHDLLFEYRRDNRARLRAKCR